MKNLAIKAENISKQYRLGEVGTGTLSHDLNRIWHKMRGNEDPYLKIGESNDRSKKGESDYVWSLKDINFEIEQGEAVGIIGKNGAGKSTLLKILSKVTKPTTGSIKVNGRIASLLEVGTGFNPEMTGRENIYLNGAILGMRKAEITRKLDEIIDFSGVERYIDTPVKRYSSGMYVRLAFAVAAHLDSEILIVDEVLAVGDADFQKKCLGKMGDVSSKTGKTVLFVSHNLPSLKAVCKSGLLLKNGILQEQNSIEKIINNYMSHDDNHGDILSCIRYLQPYVKINQLLINNRTENFVLLTGNILHIAVNMTLLSKRQFEIDFHVKKDDAFICSFSNIVKENVREYEPGSYQFTYDINLPELKSGIYKLDIYFTEPFKTWFAVTENDITIEVINDKHHMYLNNPSLKWGSVLLEGQFNSIDEWNESES